MYLYLQGIFDALTAQAIFFISILIFAARIAGRKRLAYWLGIPQLLTGIPLIYMLFLGSSYGPPVLFYGGIGMMLTWLILKLVLVYLLRAEFRRTHWEVIYMLLFFFGTAGMVAVSFQAGVFWFSMSVITFLIMIGFAFVQRFRANNVE